MNLECPYCEGKIRVDDDPRSGACGLIVCQMCVAMWEPDGELLHGPMVNEEEW